MQVLCDKAPQAPALVVVWDWPGLPPSAKKSPDMLLMLPMQVADVLEALVAKV